MRCLYCGKELALLKRLRGGGDFCSDAHKQSYQEEYNRLALSRLLQAQKKGQQTSSSPAQSAAPPPSVAVAVEEREPEESASRPQAAAVLEVAVVEARTQATPEAPADEAVVEESAVEAAEEAGTSVGTEPEPLETAGFLLESPALAALPEEKPYLESWLELSAGPAMSEWQLQNGALGLSAADLLSVDLRLTASSIEDRACWPGLSPQAFSRPQPDPSLATPVNGKIRNANRLPAGGAIALDVGPRSVAAAADSDLVQAVGFDTAMVMDDPPLLELWHTAVDFPAEDADVVPVAPSQHGSAAEFETAEAQQEARQDDSPRASLEALTRLHQELVEQETTQAEPVKAAVEIVEAVSVEVMDPPESIPDESPEAEPEAVEITAEEHRPRFATELFEISIKTFPPAKPAPIGGDALPSHVAPLLPQLKALPLRPKIALATGYVPPPGAAAPADSKPASPAPNPVRISGPAKIASGSKPAARLTQPKQPAPSGKPGPPAAAKAPEARPASPAPPLQPKPSASQPAPVPEAGTVRPDVPEGAQKAPPAENEQAPKPEPAADQSKPAADQAGPAATPAKPAGEKAKPAADQPTPATDQRKPSGEPRKPALDSKRAGERPTEDTVPSFGIAQPAGVSWLGSLKVKLGIALILLLIACTYFLWGGGKSSRPASANRVVPTDGSGPSIIMGEGGWVEGWGGDPVGMHAGRQITIYRPSLKLSDYRLEFQGSIDTKSVGWVFRASDPEDYYAMKLMTVSSGLPVKVALFKYLVANGKQTQVGRVPIDLAVQQDTVFNVRVDVRGPQFTTYLQGQQVDSWTDDQLKVGGAGFLNEREERGKVKAVSIRYLNGAAK
jgi:hypothetical protein